VPKVRRTCSSVEAISSGASQHEDYHVKRGSLRAHWFRREAPNRLYGTYTVRFQDGDLGWGRARVTEWPTSWRSFYRVNW
jgi:hypothetical protein